MGKTLNSHIIHSLGGEYCWIVWDSEPIGLLKSPRSLSLYILINNYSSSNAYDCQNIGCKPYILIFFLTVTWDL